MKKGYLEGKPPKTIGNQKNMNNLKKYRLKKWKKSDAEIKSNRGQ